MKLTENPIFLTQKRLVHRAGVIAPVLIGLLIGASMLAALIFHLELNAAMEHPRESPSDLGCVYYAWLFALQAAVLVIGGFSRISRTLVEERKAGLVDGNRLTPLTGSQLVVGYWLGSGLREFYMAAALVPIGLAMVIVTKLPPGLWAGTQLLLFSSALFFGMLGVLAGMAMPRAQGGIGIVVIMIFLLPATLTASRFSLTNFLMPVYAAVHLFHPSGVDGRRWADPVGFYKMTVHPLVYTLLLQVVLGVVSWRGAVRKFGNPGRPALVRGEAVVLYGLLVFLQYGLIWNYPETYPSRDDIIAALCAVHGGILVVGIILLGTQSLRPEEVRIAVMRGGRGAVARMFWKSGPCTALILAIIASAGLLTQFSSGFSLAGRRFVLASANAVVVLTAFSLLLELCRLQFQKRAFGFLALGLFILYGLPFLLSLTFSSAAPLKFSLVSPGVAALIAKDNELRTFEIATVAHYVIVLTLVHFWMTHWNRWLGRKSAGVRMSV